MPKQSEAPGYDPQWKTLARNDWSEILALLEKKTYQRKFQIIEAFVKLVAQRGFYRVTHLDIAEKCHVTRQLVDHHFPTESALIALTYRYIYAKFQKAGADGIMAKVGFSSQFKGYLDAVADWVWDSRSDARFLVHFYSLLQLAPDLLALHERNTRIGQERIAALCVAAQKEGLFPGLSRETFLLRATSVQMQIIGFIILVSANEKSGPRERLKQELLRSCLEVIGLPKAD